MGSMNREQLKALEEEVNTELESRATPTAEPIKDGVVDFDLYLASNPKILWILKEPYDEITDGVPSGGGWSITEHILSVGKFGNRPPFAPIAYITYSIFNGFPKWSGIRYVTEDQRVKEAIKRIAYINVSKMPALPRSGGTDFGSAYRENRDLLHKQINGVQPDVIIGGGTLHLFFNDWQLSAGDFSSAGSAAYCSRNGRLYIDAYHPSQTSVAYDIYVDDIVSIIKEHRLVPPFLDS